MRTVSVELRLNVAGFVASARTASGAVGEIGRTVQRGAATVTSGMSRAAGAVSGLENTIRTSTGRQKEALDRVGRAGTVMAVGLVAGFGLAVKASMDFDRQMSAVKANAGATAGELQQLRQAALAAGTSTAFSATQAAQAEEELAKAGVSARNVIGGGLKGALDLASAGQISVAESAETAATAMTQFGLSGKDVPHIADLLSAGANKAQGSVHDLGYALKMGGLVANQFGLSVEDTTGTMAAFASQGLIGSDSGTSFKTMLLHLAAPTNKASSLMQELGIQTYDASGKFIGITGLADQLQTKLGGLSEAQRNTALATIFGTDAIRGANILYKEGSAGIQDWINKVNDSGNASRTAGTKLDNLSGDLTKLKGAVTTALIGAGDGAKGPLRELTQGVTGVVHAFSSMPGAAQSATIWVAGISGAALLGAKGLIFLTTTVKDTKIAMEAFGLTGARVGAAMTGLRAALGSTAGFLAGPWGVAIAAAVGVIALFSASKNRAAQATAEFTAAIKEDSGALGENTRAAVANKLEQEGISKAAKDAGLSLPQVTDAVLGNKGALEQVNTQLDAYEQKLRDQISTGGKSRDQVLAQIYQIEQLRKSIGGQNASLSASAAAAKRVADATANTTGAQGQAATAAGVHAAAENDLASAMSDAAKTADDLKRALDDLSKGNMDADRAAIAQRASALAAAKAADHRAGLTDKEKTALLDLADADHKVLITQKANGATGEDLAKTQGRLAEQFIKTAMASGKNREQATELARRYGLLDPAVSQATNTIGGYITQVTAAASAQRGMDLRTGSATEAQRLYSDRIRNNLPVLYALAGSNQAAKAQVDALARSSGNAAGAQLVTRSAFLKNAAAMGIATGKAQDLWAAFKKIQSKQVKLTVLASGSWQMAGGKGALLGAGAGGAGFATGGRVPALGPASSRAYDSVPAMLRVDEHVWTPEEVDAVGGHAAMYRMRRAALAGRVKGYAAGGQVSLTGGGSSAAATAAVLKPIATGYGQLITAIGNTFAAAWKKFAGNGGPVVAAVRSQIGLPYSWGGGGTGGPSYGIGRGAGTYGFDCSGLTQYAWWKGRHKDIGGVTDSQWANSTPISGPRPGALAFPSGPSVHVMLGSSKPGYVIQAPYTGSFVQEVPRSSGNWRWPKGLAKGGEVKLGELVTGGRGSHTDALLAKVLQIAGSGPRGAERHTAQIAGPGEMRLWAEPETGGEAYIPLAQSKRSRSKAILAAVASRFGMSVRGMADGGITTYAAGGTTDLNLSDLLSQYNDIANPATKADVTAAVKARRTQLDQLRNAEDALAKARKAHHKDWALIRKDERRVAAERRDVAAATAKLTDVENRYNKAKMSPATRLGAALALGIRNTGAFIANLTRLADRGFGTLAQQLLGMGGTEAEKIAADAVKFSSKKLGALQGQVGKAQQQQQILTNLPNILTTRAALKNGTVRTWMDLIRVAELSPEDLATAVRLMKPDLLKTKYGKTIWAQMIAQGYAGGGWITGAAGADNVPIMATGGEYMVRRRQAGKYGPLVEAINEDRVGDALLRRYISGGGAAVVRGGDGVSAPAPMVGELHLNHVPGYSVPQDVTRALRQVELTQRYNRRR